MLNIAVSIADAGSYLYEGEYVTAFTMLGVGMIPGGKLGMKVIGGLRRQDGSRLEMLNALQIYQLQHNLLNISLYSIKKTEQFMNSMLVVRINILLNIYLTREDVENIFMEQMHLNQILLKKVDINNTRVISQKTI